jgi:regulator of sirC expression with transglutaminase-like and TPR domain
MSTDKREIESLIYLLEDPDPEVQTGVQNRFRELGENAVPLLDEYRTGSVKDSERETIDNIIYSITYESMLEEYAAVVEQGIDTPEQLEGALLALSRFGNPTLRPAEVKKKLNQLSSQVGGDIAYTPSMVEKMQIMLQFVFRELRFRGDSNNYHHPDNAFLDRVIERRKGLPIMLGIVVLLLSRRLELPFYGVNMPIHFMLMYETYSQEILIDPFDGGTIVTYDQCCHFLKKNGIEPRPQHLQKTDELSILLRTIRNLIHSYAKRQDEKRVNDLRHLLQLAEKSRD